MSQDNRPKKKSKRFQLLDDIVALLPTIHSHRVENDAAYRNLAGGDSASLAAMILWQRAYSKNSEAWLTAKKLGEIMGCSRNTAMKSLLVLLELKVIAPVRDENGRAIQGRWVLQPHECTHRPQKGHER